MKTGYVCPGSSFLAVNKDRNGNEYNKRNKTIKNGIRRSQLFESL